MSEDHPCLLSFVVTSRTRELGVRAAMGAQRSDLVSLVARDSAAPVVCGLMGGLALAVIALTHHSCVVAKVDSKQSAGVGNPFAVTRESCAF